MRRSSLIKMVDRLRFRALTTSMLIDQPKTKYQPLPFLGINETYRAQGSISRLEAIQEHLKQHKVQSNSLIDYGCNVGFFALSLAREGMFSFGVEEDSVAIETAYTAARIADISFCPIRLRINSSNISMMPQTDISLCLSIWHHWVKNYGLPEATEMLRVIFQKTIGVMFFDTGENEMPASYNLPFQNEPASTWLESYFYKELGAKSVSTLGKHKAFAPGQYQEEKQIQRTLYAVHK